MEQENYDNSNDRKIESVFSSRVRAGKRRTYFFDVRATRANDYFLTITESVLITMVMIDIKYLFTKKILISLLKPLQKRLIL